MADGEAKPQLYLVCHADAPTLPRLAALMDAVPFSAILLEPGAEGNLTAGLVNPMIELAQKRGVATLLADDIDLARIVKADGVHLSWHKNQEQRFAQAREALGVRYMLGADAGRSRHEAMVLGEAGADYVAFGIPSHVEDRDTAKARQTDLLQWWSEIFEVPSVAFAAETEDDVRRMVSSGADFVAVRLPNIGTVAETVAWASQIAAALKTDEAIA